MRFTVADIASSGPLTYKWQRNDKDLSEGGGVSGTTTDTLTIASVEKNNEGTYMCVVRNVAGVANTSNAVQLAIRKCLLLLFLVSNEAFMCVCV